MVTRERVSTTVDADLLRRARALQEARPDSALMDAALRALLDVERRARIDAAYERAYDRHPMREPDAWGDLASWSEAVGRS